MIIKDVEMTAGEVLDMAGRHLKSLRSVIRRDNKEYWYPHYQVNLRRIIVLLHKVDDLMTEVIANNAD